MQHNLMQQCLKTLCIVYIVVVLIMPCKELSLVGKFLKKDKKDKYKLCNHTL